MVHRIEVFSASCPLCHNVVDEIEAGKCAGCRLIVYNLPESLELSRKYGVRVVPTVIIDGYAVTKPMLTSKNAIH